MAALNRLTLLLLSIQPLWAQYIISAKAGTVHFITGGVFIDGKPVDWTPVRFPQLDPGQVLTTGNGRAEILLGPGTFLRLAPHGALRMLDISLENAQVEIQQGSALVEVVEIPKGSEVHVVLGPARTGFRGIGLHSFDAASHQIRVFGGNAEVVAGDQRAEAGRGAAVHLGQTISVSKFNPRRKDDLLVWSANRSLELFIDNMEARSHPSNWEVRLASGVGNKGGPPSDQRPFISDRDLAYYSNRDFGATFYSRPFASDPALWAPAPATSK